MPIVKSKHDSKIAYCGVTLNPLADTSVSHEQVKALREDPDFARHQAIGHVSIHDDLVAAEEAAPVVDPRAKRKGEKAKDFEARIAGYDAFLTDWFAGTDEDRAVLADTLTDEQKLLIAADARSVAPQE